MKSLVVLTVFAALMAMVSCRVRTTKFGAKGPHNGLTFDDCGENVDFIADSKNLCWYWECNDKVNNLVPRRCALGSRMPTSYILGTSNPCSINFNSPFNFTCTRDETKIEDSAPSCVNELRCFNGGEIVHDDNYCWCNCTAEWRGNFDCSQKTRNVTEVDTEVEECDSDIEMCDIVGGCLNGGTCHNQCKAFWCDCPVPFTSGKRCEAFSCESNPCKNGGTCNRGEDNLDEVSQCTCPPGYRGLLCELSDKDEKEPQETAVEGSGDQ